MVAQQRTCAWRAGIAALAAGAVVVTGIDLGDARPAIAATPLTSSSSFNSSSTSGIASASGIADASHIARASASARTDGLARTSAAGQTALPTAAIGHPLLPAAAKRKAATLSLRRTKLTYRAGTSPAKVRISAKYGSRAGRGKARVKVAGRWRTLALKKGAATFSLPRGLKPGRYAVTVKYRQSARYRYVTRTTRVIVQNAQGYPALAATARLKSVRNFRDVAGKGNRGYRTVSGRYLAKGVFYRSNVLRLSAKDAATLRSLDIARVYDIRRPAEIRKSPDRSIKGAKRRVIDIVRTPNSGGLEQMYVGFADNASYRKQLGTLLRSLAATDAPQLFHCQAGKDRTGWSAALLLTIAGVPRETIRRDYLASNAYLSRPDAVKLAWLDTAFAHAEARYGSMDSYLRSGLGLSERDITRLRAKLLV